MEDCLDGCAKYLVIDRLLKRKSENSAKNLMELLFTDSSYVVQRHASSAAVSCRLQKPCHMVSIDLGERTDNPSVLLCPLVLRYQQAAQRGEVLNQ